uniref:Uncharacterized protein LOC101291673 n=1 Tax=Rhizophora mucronata TaxID=61149 RepID=A0A2P2L2K5_RHIMU
MERDGKMETEEKEKEILCKRCKNTYISSSNTSSSCRFHPSFFVCRRHDDQKRRTKEITAIIVYGERDLISCRMSGISPSMKVL